MSARPRTEDEAGDPPGAAAAYPKLQRFLADHAPEPPAPGAAAATRWLMGSCLFPGETVVLGELALTSTETGRAAPALEVALWREGGDGIDQFMDGCVRHAADAWATPRRWRLRSRMAAGRDAAAYRAGGTPLETTVDAAIEAGELRVAGRAPVALGAGPVILRWPFMHALARGGAVAPEAADGSLAMIDEDAFVKTGQRLRRAGAFEPGGAERLETAVLTGPGNPPTVFFFKPETGLWAVVSGSELHVRVACRPFE